MRFPLGFLTVLAAFAASLGIIWLAYGDVAEVTVSGEAPLITASVEPLKRAPVDPGGEAVIDSGGIGPLLTDQPGAAEEHLLPRPEQPVSPSEVGDGDEGPESRTASRVALDALVSEIRSQPLTDSGGSGGPNPNSDTTFPTPPRPAERVAVGRRSVDGVRREPIEQESLRPLPGSDQPVETDLAAIDRSGSADGSALTRVPSPDGRYRIQLAAVRGESDAKRAWTLFLERLGPLVAGLQPFFERAETSNGIFYRVQVGPFGETGEANEICDELKKQDVSCFVVTR